MKPHIPKGGFFCWKGASPDETFIQQDFEDAEIVIPEPGVILACRSEFPGQGIVQEGSLCIAYDLLLTNKQKLCNQIGSQELSEGKLLFQLYKREGINFINLLRGAFAFALWDASIKTLHVVTDFFGIRPVVYSENSDGFAAASRVKQLTAIGSGPTINKEAIYNYLFFEAICSPLSIFHGVKKLEPGKALTINKNQLHPWTYYDIKYNPIYNSEAYWCKTIPEEIEKAFRRYVLTKSPEETGCFLSGGTDSSTIAGFCTNLTKRPARTFSIGFDDPEYNELGYARIVAESFGTEHHEYVVTPEDVLNLIDHLSQIYDEPFGNASVVAAYFCAVLARQNGVKEMLGGDGGDEIFGGNERYVQNLVFQNYRKLPPFFRTALLEPILSLAPSFGILHKAKRYVRRAKMSNPYRFYSYNLLAENDNNEIFHPDFLASIDTGSFIKHAQKLYDQADPAHDTNRLLYLDMKNTITDNDLRKVNQMVEAAGLQANYPFLDRDLVDFSAQIPPELKVKQGRNRYIFKQAMTGFLPEQVIRKKKHGMGLPIAKWFKEHPLLQQRMQDTLFSTNARLRNVINGQYLKNLRSSFENDKTSYYGDNLWVFFVLENWLREKDINI